MANAPSQQSRATAPSTAAQAILDTAEKLAQTSGYNGFSYADIAAELSMPESTVRWRLSVILAELASRME